MDLFLWWEINKYYTFLFQQVMNISFNSRNRYLYPLKIHKSWILKTYNDFCSVQLWTDPRTTTVCRNGPKKGICNHPGQRLQIVWRVASVYWRLLRWLKHLTGLDINPAPGAARHPPKYSLQSRLPNLEFIKYFFVMNVYQSRDCVQETKIYTVLGILRQVFNNLEASFQHLFNCHRQLS